MFNEWARLFGIDQSKETSKNLEPMLIITKIIKRSEGMYERKQGIFIVSVQGRFWVQNRDRRYVICLYVIGENKYIDKQITYRQITTRVEQTIHIPIYMIAATLRFKNTCHNNDQNQVDERKQSRTEMNYSLPRR